MLKSRYADTILKPKHILDHGDEADPVKMQQQKGKLERRQREEKAKIEAQIRAADAAAKMKAEVESRSPSHPSKVFIKSFQPCGQQREPAIFRHQDVSSTNCDT
ncbi:hypothetical protein QQP08_026483 [Theobroma cacao]|nr:hypothetical protein QQP08_026483 [Theobroma cacao]